MKIDVSMVLMVGLLPVLFGLWGVLRHKGDLMRQILALLSVFSGAVFNFALGGALFRDSTGVAFAFLTACLTGVLMTACLCLFLLYCRRHKHLDAQRIDGMKG